MRAMLFAVHRAVRGLSDDAHVRDGYDEHRELYLWPEQLALLSGTFAATLSDDVRTGSTMSRKVNPRAVVITRVRQEAYREVARSFQIKRAGNTWVHAAKGD